MLVIWNVEGQVVLTWVRAGARRLERAEGGWSWRVSRRSIPAILGVVALGRGFG